MESQIPTVTLSNGVKVPIFGLGTFLGRTLKKELIGPIVKAALLDYGYRLLDTAMHYEYEEEIGSALEEVFKTGKVKREDIFIVNKLWNDCHDKVEETIRKSLKRMRLDYFDLYLIHWPMCECIDYDKLEFQKVPIQVTWRGMETCYKKGLTKAIGVSNFNCQSLLDLFSYAEIRPMANQIEIHPYLPQTNLVWFCHKVKIQPMAYSPLSSPGSPAPGTSVLVDPIIQELAKKYGKTTAQICLSWGMSKGNVIISATKTISRLKENAEAIGFTMEKEDIQKIDEIKVRMRVFDPMVGLFDKSLHIPIFD